MHECEKDDKQQNDLQLIPYECAMLHDFELYNDHAESAEIEKWSILHRKIDYIEYNRKEVSLNNVSL